MKIYDFINNYCDNTTFFLVWCWDAPPKTFSGTKTKILEAMEEFKDKYDLLEVRASDPDYMYIKGAYC